MQEGLILMKSVIRVVPREMTSRPYLRDGGFFYFKKVRRNKMESLGLNEIRERFLSFFEKKGHLRLPSFSLVPKNDNSLLLINSGMAPLKPYFIGIQKPPRKRVTTCQKCIRTPDIERVGQTARHATFFEMLGNFSFGDYFKKEIIEWAWEFIMQELKIPEDRLWVSIYKEDNEAFEIWTKKIGVSPERIVRLGKKDNFWEIGVGPCGPSSEIYFDRGEQAGCGKENCTVGCDCDRFVEFWNLVFTQFNRDEEGNYTPIKHPNIDTGMGLERIAAIMQGVDSIFEVDTIRHILDYVCSLAKIEYGKDVSKDMSIRVITDHIRSVTFMVSDGILPSNEGRGYVLRRLLRRAARHGKLLGIQEPFLYKICHKVIEVSKDAYPELKRKEESIEKIIYAEEERFQQTIDQGLSILQDLMNELITKNSDTISGIDVFKLYDTYGFPLELTMEIAQEKGLKVDENGFYQEMKKQKERARNARKITNIGSWKEDVSIFLRNNIETEFIGYNQLEAEGKVLGIVKQGKNVQKALKGEEVELLLDKTSFYGESGGQVGDCGIIKTDTGEIYVKDCKKISNRIIHYCKIIKGSIEKDQRVKTYVNKDFRMNTARNHTCTHILQKVLKEVLGDHVEQAGSLVTPDKLRFDFKHFTGLSQQEIKDVENRVNEIILQSLPVKIIETTLDKAKKMGAIALFDEKYGEKVRLVQIGDFSLELCGGTHLSNSSQVGFFKIINESSVASGIRRIEATSGKKAIEFCNSRESLLFESANLLKVTPMDLPRKIEELLKTIRGQQKEIEQLKSKITGNIVEDLLNAKEEISGIPVIIAQQEDLDIDALRKLADQLKDKMNSGVVILASNKKGKIHFVSMATKDVVQKGIHVGNLIRKIAQITDGGGGGRANMAQAGGKDLRKLPEALEKAKEFLAQQIKK